MHYNYIEIVSPLSTRPLISQHPEKPSYVNGIIASADEAILFESSNDDKIIRVNKKIVPGLRAANDDEITLADFLKENDVTSCDFFSIDMGEDNWELLEALYKYTDVDLGMEVPKILEVQIEKSYADWDTHCFAIQIALGGMGYGIWCWRAYDELNQEFLGNDNNMQVYDASYRFKRESDTTIDWEPV